MNRPAVRPPGWAELLAPTAAPAPLGDLALLRVSRRAMATTFEIALPDGTPNALAAAEAALDLVDDLEQQLTVYRDSSEVSHVNRTAHTSPVPVEAGLFALLTAAVALSVKTNGAFDPAAGALIDAWATARRAGRIPTPAELAAARACTGCRHLVLDAAANTVRFRVPGLKLNLGGIGKGYALDRVIDQFATNWGIRSALVQAGGSSVRALGTPPTDPRGWLVSIRHPADDAATIGAMYLRDEALGTSGCHVSILRVCWPPLWPLARPANRTAGHRNRKCQCDCPNGRHSGRTIHSGICCQQRRCRTMVRGPARLWGSRFARRDSCRAKSGAGCHECRARP